MHLKIIGTAMPVLQIGIDPGERILAETGRLSWMSAGVRLQTTTLTSRANARHPTRGHSGRGLTMTEYSSPASRGMIAFAAKAPGQIIELEVGPERSYMVHRNGFLCATEGVELDIGFYRSAGFPHQALGLGRFGSDGFVLQKLSGTCLAWVELGGEAVSYDLKPDETLHVHPRLVGMFEDSVSFDITMLPGIRDRSFGGDGLFLAQLTGPGKIWLQTMASPDTAQGLTPQNARDMLKDAIVSSLN